MRSAPALILGGGSRFLLRQLRRLARGPIPPFLWRWCRRRARVGYFNIVSHHFMSASELETPEGRERLDLCVFKVPVGDQFVSMCELNSLGTMTHGDAFRRDPDFLARLMVQGELTELSIHVDTTQRGRSGSRYKLAVHEEELDPLREEFADLIRRVRRKTRRPLKVALGRGSVRAGTGGI